VTRVLEEILLGREKPMTLRSDNGPEFTSRQFLAWCAERGIEVIHIEPGRPVQNAHVESFHGRLREECLNASWFQNLFDARRKIAAWRHEYNEQRPHSSLGYQTAAAFARQAAALRSPTAPSALPLGPVPESASQGPPPRESVV
jgi:putative transposase